MSRRDRSSTGAVSLFDGEYGAAWRQDPVQAGLRLRRECGPVVAVRLHPRVQGFLVLDRVLVEWVLRAPDRWWSRNTRGCPALAADRIPPELVPVLGWRPTVRFADGDGHTRLRRAVDEALGGLHPDQVRRAAEAAARRLIDGFAGTGRADLVEFAERLPVMTIAGLLGADERRAVWLAEVVRRTSQGGGIARQATADLYAALQDLILGGRIALRHGTRRRDLLARLLTGSVRLSPAELLHHLVLLLGVGHAPTSAVLSSALLQILTCRDTAQGVAAGVLDLQDVVDAVLWHRNPSVAFPWVIAMRETELGGVRIPAQAPVGLALAAADHPLAPPAGAVRNRGHLGFGVGRHRCPAERLAVQIITTGMGAVLDRLTGLTLAVPAGQLVYEATAFQQRLRALPVHFHSSRKGDESWTRSRSIPAQGTCPVLWPPGSATLAPSPRSRCPAGHLIGR